jgi:uncharacterized protein
MVSVILMPTLNCNAQCRYCWLESGQGPVMSHADLRVFIEKLMIYLEEEETAVTRIYWQGGEIFTMEPSWFEEALRIIEDIARPFGISVAHDLQTNLMAYSDKWDSVITGMFGNSIGSSLDFPNRHRRIRGESVQRYNEEWRTRLDHLNDKGIGVGVICVLNSGSLGLGAEALYDYYVEHLGLGGFQINMPFPVRKTGDAADMFPLDSEKTALFMIDLAQLWIEKGLKDGVRISPITELLDYFVTGKRAGLPCVWMPQCSDHFISVDPLANVFLCDCWVKYSDYWFGNAISSSTMASIMASPRRKLLRRRSLFLVSNSDCGECSYLGLCHGGCTTRAFSTYGDIFRKDPYCRYYKALFARMERAAAELGRTGEILTANN